MSDKHKPKTQNEKLKTQNSEKSEVALREEEILKFWEENDIFNKSVNKKAPNGDFVFYDGPPFATGLPHYGHILAGTIKDAIPRFWTMNGYRVRRKWGWDCHGLPLENLIEKKLGLATKRDIEEYGVKNFNEAARGAVLEYADDWKKIVPRMGRWADMDNDYKTMDATYTESVWWVFSELNKKGLVYEGFKSMHLCPRCGTTLSNFEVNLGYKDIKDIAVYVELPLVDEPNTSLIVWTTTPWTLPGNMAAAVHKDQEYVVIEKHDEGVGDLVRFIVAKDRLKAVFGEDEYQVVKNIKGQELVGKAYLPPFDFWQKQEFAGKENSWKIYHADYVDVEGEGTGAVHIAPAYGEEDMELAKAHNIPIVHHVDQEGHFLPFVEGFSCALVKPKDDDDAEVSHLDTDIEIVKKLKENGRLFKKENITHSYPHCWRCDTPLLNYATNSWFIKVTDIKDKLVKENRKVNWVPEHVGMARFGKWLEGARDWAVSRQRYWGAPLPIWRNPKTKEYKVFGSLAELQEYVPKSGNKYFLMRHGEADSNLDGSINADPSRKNPLTERGREQVLNTAEDLKKQGIDLIIHSGLERTRDTAKLVGEKLGLSQAAIVEDSRLNELNAGADLEGKKWSDYEALFGSVENEWNKNIDGVENRRDVNRRAGALLYELESKHKGKKILLVGHISTLNALRYVVSYGAEMSQALTTWRKEGNLNTGVCVELPFTPLPHNDNYELDYHRPYIDDFEVYEKGGTKLERVPDVFDCWYESGSMPYGQLHYPFEHKKDFAKEYFPAQFIAEGLDQTRGWFYSLIVLGVALFGKSPYQNVIVNGLVLAEDGKKMSKKLQNYPAPMDLVERQGADSMRFYLLSSSIMRAEDLNFSEKEVQELQRKNLGRLHNVLAMFKEYTGGEEANDKSKHVLDRWIVARLNELTKESTEGFKNYELDKATRPISDFIDDLSVWYLRRSRERIKSSDEKDKQAALSTLKHVLKNLALVMAPSMPFYAEYLWREIKEEGDEESVHLANWPKATRIHSNILENMRIVREAVTKGLEARTKAGIKVRQPLQALVVHINDAQKSIYDDNSLVELIKDELNIKEIIMMAESNGTEHNVSLDTNISPELQMEGDAREFMRAVQDLRKEKGLSAKDRVRLIVQTSDSGEAVVKTFLEEIKNKVGADSIEFSDANGEEIKAGEHSFTIELKKV